MMLSEGTSILEFSQYYKSDKSTIYYLTITAQCCFSIPPENRKPLGCFSIPPENISKTLDFLMFSEGIEK